VKNTDRSFVFLALGLLGALGILLSKGCSGASGPAASASIASRGSDNNVKLDFSLPAADGTRVDLKKFDGQVRVVDFWATWCPPCRLAIPHLNELQRKYKDRGVAVLGISVDENPKAVAAFDRREVHIEYASLLTSDAAEEAFGGVVGLPSTFVLDRQGRIYKSYVGFTAPETLEDDVQAVLAAK